MYRIEYDTVKSERNRLERGLCFEQVAAFNFETAIYEVDERRDYGEVRIRALGFLDERLHALVFIDVTNGIRIISFRKANKREVSKYEKTIKSKAGG